MPTLKAWDGTAWVDVGGSSAQRFVGNWTVDQAAYPTPGTGKINFYGNSQTATGLFIHQTEGGGTDWTQRFNQLAVGDIIVLVSNTVEGNWTRWRVNAALSGTTVRTVPVTVIATAGSAIADGVSCRIEFAIAASGTGGGGGTTVDLARTFSPLARVR